ncbi:MAG: hypothetical protein IJV85_01685 [Clostridia bacterium]|nr:hypothetical protein [Clostridia bacterium]
MDIASIDKNFALKGVNEPDIEWFDPLREPFSLHGVFYDKNTSVYDEEPGLFLRMPAEISNQVSYGVNLLSKMTAGGRLRFQTDSPYVAIKCIAPDFEGLYHMPLTGSHGFSLYVNGLFDGKFAPGVKDLQNSQNNALKYTFAFEGSRHIKNPSGGVDDCELYFPLYGGVRKLYIGLKKGCVLKAPKPYSIEKPLVFYGSSIYQGACASRPGNDFISLLSRWLDCDIINLGFSGNGNGEKPMMEYLTTLDASGYIFDYNYYVDYPDRVLPTHLSMYETLRGVGEKLPILLIDKPAIEYDRLGYERRREMISSTYEIAKQRGDEYVGYIDAKELFGDKGRDGCTVDTCHPTDLGFYRMAERIYPVLKELLDKSHS